MHNFPFGGITPCLVHVRVCVNSLIIHVLNRERERNDYLLGVLKHCKTNVSGASVKTRRTTAPGSYVKRRPIFRSRRVPAAGHCLPNEKLCMVLPTPPPATESVTCRFT